MNVSSSNCAGLPVREINNEADLSLYHSSSTFTNFYTFIQELGRSVIGISISKCPYEDASTNVKWAADLLHQMYVEIEKFPPKDTNSRFGNVAFRDWLDSIRKIVPFKHHERKIQLSDEISSYLVNSLGDWQRIDYGTGHEAHFIAWLYCLVNISFFTLEQYPQLVLILFVRYLKLMRRLQATYWLEPAGSHGVWGLDDYHFLPFLFGAAQLTGKGKIQIIILI